MRASIIAAARRLIERDGQETLTLSAVAGEARIARATIYGYFSSKKDLLAQVARQGEAPPAAPEEPVPAGEASANSAAPAAEAGAEPPPATTPEEPAQDTAAEPVAAPDTAQADYEAMMRAQAEALGQLAKRVIVPRSMQKEGTDTVLSRLEARLSVAEQSVAALEKRLNEHVKGLSGETASLGEKLQHLGTRVERSEERHLAALAELRLDVHNLSGAGRSETPSAPPAAASLPKPPVPEAPLPEAPAEPAEPPAASRAPDYLTNARQAAIAAAQQAEAPANAKRRKFKLGRRQRWQILGIIALIVIAFDAFVFLHYQPVAPAAVAAVLPQRAAARPTLLQLAAAGNPEAQLTVGLKYLNGNGVAIDLDKAAKWLERAASAGQPVAQNYVGVMYQTGTGVTADMAGAMRWYEASAERGNVKAMTNLGKAYAGGWREGTDFALAAQWFGRAAALGDVDAEFDLAILYERGEGVSRSVPDAYKWYAIAAANGDRNAAARAAILSAQLLPGELKAAQDAVAAFKPAAADLAANDLPTAAKVE